jgi:copper resistance protein B
MIGRALNSLIMLGALPALAQTTGQSWPPPVRDNEMRYFVQFTQMEGRVIGPPPTFRWESEGWIGTNYNKLWIKSEGDVTSGTVSDGDHEALYDRPIPHLRYFDWQAGVRVDGDSGPTRTWGAVGIQGLAPYFFEFEPTFYFRGGGVAAKIDGLYNLYVTQRLILQPQIELNFYSSRDPARGIGTGLSDLDGGVRLGYQISRKFAPYVGFTYTGVYNETATFARRAGERTHAARLAFGIWVWR